SLCLECSVRLPGQERTRSPSATWKISPSWKTAPREQGSRYHKGKNHHAIQAHQTSRRPTGQPATRANPGISQRGPNWGVTIRNLLARSTVGLECCAMSCLRVWRRVGVGGCSQSIGAPGGSSAGEAEGADGALHGGGAGLHGVAARTRRRGKHLAAGEGDRAV